MGTSLHVGVLGPLLVTGPHGAVPLPALKEQALLAHLVTRANQTVPVEDLVATLWGAQPPRTAVKALQNHVLRVRKALEPARDGAPRVIVTDPGGYRLVLADEAVDARRFERLVELGRRAVRDGRWAAASETLTDARGLWRGRAYEGLEWTTIGATEARRLDELRRLATEDQVAAGLELGRADEVVSTLESLVAADPLRERAWELLVLALYRSGRQAESLAAYRQVRDLLDEELGVAPGPSLKRLHDQVLRQDPALLGPGEHAVLPRLLTPPSGPFVGRQAPLARLQEVWRSVVVTRHPRDLLLRAPRGTGVSRLAAELAAWVVDDGGIVEVAGPEAATPALPVGGPTLLVVDLRTGGRGAPVQVHPDAPVLTLLLATPDHAAPAGIEVLDLPALDRSALALLLADYLGEEPGDDSVDRVVLESGGRPGRVHELALGLARRQVAARVTGGATRVQHLGEALDGLRDDLGREVARSVDLAERAQASGPAACPWPGLSPYRQQDAGVFAGRERLTAELLSRVATSRLISVVGASGSGKSSLVQAGLLGALAAGALPGSERWALLTMRPGAHPMTELARIALRGAEPSADDVAALLQRAVFGESGAGHLVLVVDQLEELWTAGAADDERRAFLDTLSDVVTGPSRMTVVLICRADHVGVLAEHEVLAALFPSSSVLVGTPTPAELRRAVEVPAARAGLACELGLVDALVDDAGVEPGSLPLLSTCLSELYQRRVGRTLTLGSYVEIGGLRGAVARVAERAFTALPEPDQQAARVVLLRLAGTGPADAVSRRRARLAELAELPDPRVAAVVEPLVDARLLTLDDGVVEVAHEALFREWPRLRAWLDEDATTRTVLRRLTQAAQQWESDGRDDTELWRGSRLAGGMDLLTVAPGEVTALEREFLAAGRAAQQAQEQEVAARAAATAHQNRRLRWLLGGLGLLLGAALVAGGLAARSDRQAQAARAEAEISARVATARELAAAATAAVATDPELGVLLAREAVAATDDPLPEAVEALHTAVVSSRVVATWTEPGVGGALDWSPDGTYVVTEGPEASGLVQVRDPDTGDVGREWVGHGVDLNDVVIGADGTLATVGDDGAAVAWDPRTGTELGRVETDDGGAFTPTVSGDGSVVAASFASPGVIGLVDLRSGEQWTVQRPGFVGWPGLNPAGTELAVGRWDDGPGVVEILDPRTGAVLRTMVGGFDRYIGALAWSPDGRWIAVVGDDEVRVWDASTGTLAHTFAGHSRFTVRLDWAPDSSRIASASHDGTARVWPVTADAEPVVLTSAALAPGVLGVAFDDTGTQVLAGNFAVDQAVVFDVGTNGSREWATVAVPEEPVTVQFTPDGSALVTAAASGGAAFVDASTGEPTGPPALREGPVVARLALSPDGSILAESGADVMRLVSVDDGSVLAERTVERDTPRPIAWHPDGELLAVAGYGAGATYLADTRGSVVRSVLEQDGFAATGVAVSPDGTRLATSRNPMGANLNQWGVTIWDWASGSPLARSDVHGEALAFSPDGRVLSVGSPSGEAMLLDVTTGATTRTLSGHLGGVLAVAYSADGTLLATGDGEGRIRLWDPEEGTLAAVLPGHEALVTGLAFSPDGSRLASVGYDGVARVWALDLDDLLAIAEGKVTREMTAQECTRYLRRDC
jgi:WD40 repeat protein/DNA-binding SARP family transcriptional activator